MRQCRRIVGTSNGHRQGAGGCAAIGVVDGVGKGVSQTLADSPALHGRVVVIHRVGIAAVAGNVDLAIGSGYVATDAAGLHASHITRRNTLYCQRVTVHVRIKHISAARTGRRHISGHTGRISRRHAFVDRSRVGIGNRQAVDVHHNGLRHRKLAAVALVLTAAGRTTDRCVTVLVIERVAQRDAGVAQAARRRHRVAVGNALHRLVHQRLGGAGIEAQRQGAKAAAITITANRDAIDLEHASIQIQATAAGARGAQHVISRCTPLTGDDQCCAGPVVTFGTEFAVSQGHIRIDHHCAAGLHIGYGCCCVDAGCIQGAEGRRIVDRGHRQLHGVGRC